MPLKQDLGDIKCDQELPKKAFGVFGTLVIVKNIKALAGPFTCLYFLT